MQRLIDFSTITLSLLLLATSGVKTLEAKVNTETGQFSNTSVLIAQAENNSQFITVEPGHPTEGTLNIIEEDGKQYIEIDNSFKTAEGPDVVIILHKDEVVLLNIQEEDYVIIAPIKSFAGAQRYEVPESLDLNKYASVAVWCQEFNITFGYAQL